MKKYFSHRIISKWLAYLAAFGTVPFFLLVWELASRLYTDRLSLFPPPSVVVHTFAAMLASGELLADTIASLGRVLVGFFFGATLGIVTGLMTGSYSLLSNTVGQLFQLLRPIPAIAFVPFAVLFFGIGENSKYFLIAWGVFFPMWLNAHIGVTKVDQKLVWTARSLGATQYQLLYYVILPSASRFMIAGARIALAIAFVCLVAAELAGAYGGIGYRITESHLIFRVDKMMVSLCLLGILGALADYLFMAIIRKFVPWYDKESRG